MLSGCVGLGGYKAFQHLCSCASSPFLARFFSVLKGGWERAAVQPGMVEWPTVPLRMRQIYEIYSEKENIGGKIGEVLHGMVA